MTATARSPLEVAAFLDVENSPRYQPTAVNTFCNIYAYDFCYLSGVYLPRVWWTLDAIKQLEKGTAVLARYADTVYDLDANALYHWLATHGKNYGWRTVASISDMQVAANHGNVCLISGARRDPNAAGHISCVLPEGGEFYATRNNGNCTAPLQSQAGRRNYRCSVKPGRWWEKPELGFANSGFFVNDATVPPVAA